MGYLRAAVIAGIVACGLGLVVSTWSGRGSRSPLATTPRSVAAPRQMVGSGSCSSTACHGSAVSDHEAWQSSHTAWASRDRHTRAYRVLFEPLAVQIIASLHARNSSEPLVAAHLNKACLGCHSTNRGESISEGVGCESCHGPAGDWLVAHTLKGFHPHDNGLGMVDLADPFVAAQQCSLCHIGGPPCEDGSLREVNHDTIAAGHPQLAFELRSYAAAQPPHWSQSHRPDPVDEWALGRLGALQAYLDNISLQVAHAQSSQSESQDHVWPEFTAMDCAGCHRLPIADNSGPEHRAGSLGAPTLDPWQWSLLDVIMPDDPLQVLFSFRCSTLKNWWTPPDQEALRQCTAAIQIARRQVSAGFETADVGVLAQKIMQSSDLTDWGQAVAASFAFVAIADRAALKAPDTVERILIAQELETLRSLLEFPQLQTARGPVRWNSPHHSDGNSPRGFDGQAIEAVCGRIVGLLQGNLQSHRAP